MYACSATHIDAGVQRIELYLFVQCNVTLIFILALFIFRFRSNVYHSLKEKEESTHKKNNIPKFVDINVLFNEWWIISVLSVVSWNELRNCCNCFQFGSGRRWLFFFALLGRLFALIVVAFSLSAFCRSQLSRPCSKESMVHTIENAHGDCIHLYCQRHSLSCHFLNYLYWNDESNIIFTCILI